MMKTEYKSARVRPFGIKAIGLLSAVVFVCLTAASETRGQEVSVGIRTRFPDRAAAKVRVSIGPRTGVTDLGGRTTIRVPVGTHKLKIEAPCRVVEVQISEGIEKSGPNLEPTLTFRETNVVKAIWIQMDCGAAPPETGDSLEVVVRRALRRIAKTLPSTIAVVREPVVDAKPIFMSARGDTATEFRRIRFEYGSASSFSSRVKNAENVKPAANTSGDPTAILRMAASCPELRPLGMSAEVEAQHAPDMAIILKASEERPEEVQRLLLAFLSTPEENRAVYGLLGGSKPGLIFNNLAKKLRPNDKLIRYYLGRQRKCERESEDEVKRWMASGKLAAQIVFVVMDIVLADLGIPHPPISTPLGYVDIVIKAQSRDPEIRKNLPGDMQKLIMDTVTSIPELPTRPAPTLSELSTVKTGPIWDYDAMSEYMGNLAQGAGPGLADEAWQRFNTLSDPKLDSEIEDRVNQARTEEEWLDRMDNERKRQGELFLWHRSVLARFNVIFEDNKWPFDPAKFNPAIPINQLFFGDRWKSLRQHEYSEFSEARNEVIRRADEARQQIIFTAYFGGVTDYEKSAPDK